MAKLSGTVLRDIRFTDCKMLGLRFDTCSAFGRSFTFDNCQLNHSSFSKAKIKIPCSETRSCRTDITEVDVAGAVFDNCDMGQAVFENTLPEKADFRTSYDYSIDPGDEPDQKTEGFNVRGCRGF